MANKGNDDTPRTSDTPAPEIPPAQDKSEELSAQAARRVSAELAITRTVEFSGPLPPPELLKGYNEVFAGWAERIVAMAERQAQHRQSLEKRVIESNCSAQSRAQWFTFVLALLVIGGGVYLLAQGRSLEGFAAIILALASLIAALIYGHTEQRKERGLKRRPLPQGPTPRTSTSSNQDNIR